MRRKLTQSSCIPVAVRMNRSHSTSAISADASMANALGNLDIRLWSSQTLHPNVQITLGQYRNLHPWRFNGRHIYWNDYNSHLLAFLRLGQGCWTLCKCQPPVKLSKIGRLVANCRRSVEATYQALQMERSLWHGGAGRFFTMPLLAGKQFFFNRSQRFEDILAEFAADPPTIQDSLQLYSYQARPLETSFFMADVSMQLGFFDRPPLNLWTLGSYFYHTAFVPEHSPCWGGGYVPQICCDRHITIERLTWCFGDVVDDIVEHCCGRYLAHPPAGSVSPALRHASLDHDISVHIFLQSFHGDRFAVLPFVESVERFWPQKWKSKIFMAVDDSTEDRHMCAEVSPRVICIYTPSLPRRGSAIDSIEWSGRSVSQRYRTQLLQYHYWLSDLYIAEHVDPPDWVAWFDADVVIHTPQVEELLMPHGLPVMFARRTQMNSMETMSLGLDWVGEFMDTFPQLVRPAHLQHFREFVQATFKGSSFLESYYSWRVAIEEAALVHGRSYGYISESEGPQSSFPVFLYHFHHDEFTWALQDSASFGLPLQDTCLSLRVASHVSHWKHNVRRGNLTEQMYAQRARRLMQLGERSGGTLRVALLSANFEPKATWSQASSAHCLGRDRETMMNNFFAKSGLAGPGAEAEVRSNQPSS